MNLQGIWERVGIRPWRLAALLVGFAIALFVVLPLVVMPLARHFLGITCDAEEKAALMEFPQYGGKVVGKDIKVPLGGEEVNFPPLQEPPPGCSLGFSVRHASPKQVSSYYEEKLTEHGWTVKRFPVKKEGNFEYPHVDGTREGLRYEVHYWPLMLQGATAPAGLSNAMGEDGTEVNVLVHKP
jgi:hypothetical protein